jgi:thymidylate kinase
MDKVGKLIVFEGADGVGKSVICSAFVKALNDRGIKVKHLSFPGKDVGTLGELVYRVHHDSTKCGVTSLTPASLQALHIAAHLDAIERVILPSLEGGMWVVLDRFWWSTWVYGVTDNIRHDLLSALVEAELCMWGSSKPSALFYINRDQPLREEPLERWKGLTSAYEDLMHREEGKYPIHPIFNDSTIDAAVHQVGSMIGLAR